MHAVLPEDAESAVEVDPFEDASDFLPIELPPLSSAPSEQAFVVLAKQSFGGVHFGEPVVEPAEDGRLQPGECVGVLTDGQEFRRVGVCLLYTSPSPRDQRGSRMPSSA